MPRTSLRALPTVCLLLALAPGAAIAQGGVTRYCQSGASGAQLFASGSTDFAANGGAGDLVLTAVGLHAQVPGLVFYGDAATAGTPLGNGSLCVAGSAGLFRLPVSASDSSGVLGQAIDYGAPPVVAAQITPGSTWNFQCWFRDGTSSDLTDALSIDFVPPRPLPFTALLTGTKSVHPLAWSQGGALVIRDQAEYDAFWALHDGFTPPQTPPAVDFTQSAIVAVFAGRRFTSGYAIAVRNVRLSVSTLDVDSLETQPGLGCGVVFTETNPFQLVTVRRVPGLELGDWTPSTFSQTCP